MVLTLLVFQFFSIQLFAQADYYDSVKGLLIKQADTLNNKIEKSTADRKEMAKQLDTLKQNDSIANTAIGTSFSNALKAAIQHPETLYNKPFKKYWYMSFITILFLMVFKPGGP